VTIGVPTWNRSGLLREALDSVLAQTFGDFELFVFDDGSTDDTLDVVASYRDPRLTYVRNERNLGHPRNVTQILTAGTAPYVGMLFDDDVMFPDHLERTVALLDAHPEAAAAHTAYELWAASARTPFVLADTDHPGQVVVETAAQFLPRIVRDAPRVWVATALLRRSRVGHLDFRASDEPATDIMFWMRVALEGPIVYDPHPTACMRVTEGYSSESQFLAQNADRLPAPLRLRLRLAELRTRHALLQAVVRRRAPGLRPVSEVLPLLREAAGIDPTVLVDPIFLGYLARERVRPPRPTPAR
jgi:glycosyltransferase involved in cell wall biosynthesis